MANHLPESLGDLRYETFEPLRDSSFILRDETGDQQLLLAEVKALANLSPDPDFRQPFTLTFRSTRQEILPQAIRKLEHAELGTIEIFLVPVARDGEGVSYEAVFN